MAQAVVCPEFKLQYHTYGKKKKKSSDSKKQMGEEDIRIKDFNIYAMKYICRSTSITSI